MKRHTGFQLFLMIIVVGLFNVDQFIVSPNLGKIEAEFHVNDASMGLMTMFFFIVGALVSLIWGYFSDKSNRKILFSLTVLIGQIPCLLTGFATNYTQFFVFRILTGIGLGASMPTIFSMLGDMYDEKNRATAVTLMTTVIGIGQIGGPLIGGYLGPVYGWRLPFKLVAAANLLTLVFFFLFTEEPKRGAGEESLKDLVEAGYRYPRTIKLADYINLAKIKTNIFLFTQGILGMIPWGAIPFFMVKFLNIHKGLTIQDATTIFTLFGVGNIVGTIAGGELGGWFLKKNAPDLPRFCAISNLAGTGVALIMFTILPPGSIASFLILGFLGSCLLSVTGPNIRTMILDTNPPENRGAIFSIFNLTDSVGAGVGPLFAGLISVAFGLNKAMIASTVIWVPCSFLLWLCSLVLRGDIDKLHQKIDSVAQEMKISHKVNAT
ncbi:MAG: MFS transporter [Firmicutes bacterium]|nr:MFS transporter [Bacillota bacterium]